MVLSRFWYIAISVALGAAVFLLYLSTSVSNRNAEQATAGLLNASSNAVDSFLKVDARKRATALIPLSVDPAIQKALAEANGKEDLTKLEGGVRDKATTALREFRAKQAQKEGAPTFDYLWAIDKHGRVLANANYGQGVDSDHFEMGGYALVADALHGWVRDDAWVIDGRIWLMVARPVETTVNGTPVGAVLAARVVVDAYAEEIAQQIGSPVAFYANFKTHASGTVQNFNTSTLELTDEHAQALSEDEDYLKSGRTKPHAVRNSAGLDISAVYARMPGEARDLGAGYVVGSKQATVSDPLEFQDLANEDDQATVPIPIVIGIALGAALLGLFFSLIEHTLPLSKFKRAMAELGDRGNTIDTLKPSTFRGAFKKIAASVNDGLDKVASAAGVERGPADLQSVLGPLPAQPQMSAFAVPKSSGMPASKRPVLPQKELPKAKPKPPPQPHVPALAPEPDEEATVEMQGGHPLGPPAAAPMSAPAITPPRKPPPSAPIDDDDDTADEETVWKGVYGNFIAMKKQFGEPTDRLTYEKFRGTLQRNKEALMARHGCTRVKFRVYEKQGRAALKASPVKE